MRELQTASDVITELGGPAATGRITDRSAQAVWNWKATGKLPADTFLVLREALTAKKCTAPAALWGMKEPERA